jgi:hypothetical protein
MGYRSGRTGLLRPCGGAWVLLGSAERRSARCYRGRFRGRRPARIAGVHGGQHRAVRPSDQPGISIWDDPGDDAQPVQRFGSDSSPLDGPQPGWIDNGSPVYAMVGAVPPGGKYPFETMELLAEDATPQIDIAVVDIRLP